MKRLLTFSLFLFCAVVMSAQIMMKVNVKDATEVEVEDNVITLPANVVKNITFEKIVPPKVDTTLTVKASNITETSATIQIDLKPADIAVRRYVIDYGTVEEILTNKKHTKEITQSSVTLNDLEPNTTYAYYAKAELADGNTLESDMAQFTTSAKKLDLSIRFTEVNAAYTSATIKFFISGDELEGGDYGLYCSDNKNSLESEANLLPNTVALRGNATYTYALNNLSEGKTYYLKAFVKTPDGRYAEVTETFTTSKLAVRFTDVTVSYTDATVKFAIDGEALEGGEYGLYYSSDLSSLETEENLAPNTEALKGNTTYTYTLDNLSEGTTYYLKAFVKAPNGSSAEASYTFTTRQPIVYAEPEPVDLGLSVKWASFNMGATTETGYGGYFGWGDATGEETRYRDGYYAPGIRDTGIRGDVNYDIATAKWGGHWRLPTPDEVLELQRCNPVRTTKNGVPGVLLTGIGSKSDNTIFIPLAGYHQADQAFEFQQFAYLWTDSIDITEQAYCVRLPSTSTLTYTAISKAKLFTIRAVWDDGAGSEPEPEIPDLSKTAKEGTENNPTTGAIPEDGVDMGGKVKWARWNVGCMTPTGGAGRYYAWGATTEQDSYTKADYASNPYYDVPREEIAGGVISSDNDVAVQLWGDGWRMPTSGEFAELYANCDKKWTTENGVEGYLLTSRENGKSIFFPAVGYKNGTSTMHDGVEGRYWTSSIFVTDSETMKREASTCFNFYKDLVSPQNTSLDRYKGLQIRPVRDK